jgi:uncharacterized protein (TIGR02594 family)
MVLKKTTQVLLLCTVALSFSSVVNAKPLRQDNASTRAYSMSDATEFSSRKRKKAQHASYSSRRAYHSRRGKSVRSVRRPVQVQQAYHSTFGELPDRHAFGDYAASGSYAPTAPYDTVGRAARSSRRATPTRYASTGGAGHDGGGGFGGGSSVVAEARRYLGGNPTGRSSLWCATFMNMVLERTGHRGTGSNLARSFASYGTRLSGPQVGAIAVMSRGRRGGHVGVVSGIDANGNPIIISGNHGRRVAESTYSRGRIYAYVMPH